MSSQPKRHDPTVTAASIAAAQAAALSELRDVAASIATPQGHLLGTWRELDDACEVAYCRSCWRAAVIDVVRQPHFTGPALSEACKPRHAEPRRPDAFLANQHESVTRGGRR